MASEGKYEYQCCEPATDAWYSQLDVRLIADDGDRLRRVCLYSDRYGILALDSGHNDERSPPACTGPTGLREAVSRSYLLEIKRAAAFSTRCK